MGTKFKAPTGRTIDYSASPSGVQVDLSTMPLVGGQLDRVMKVIGSPHDDVLHGSGLANQVLAAGDGNDVLIGGGNMAIFEGGAGNDTVDYSSVNESVVASLLDGSSQSGDTYTDIENLIGGQSYNVLTGNAAANRLIGGGLADVLDGGAGADYMAGGKGNDIYYVDDVRDVVVEAIGGGTSDQVKASISYTLGDNVETLTLTGTSAINGTGNALDNTLFGNAAANRLSGGDGNDLIRGGGGADTLTGGAGKDIFQYVAASDSKVSAMDRITDFTRGQDKLSFSSMDANAGTAANDAFRFVGTADFSHKAGELRYETHDTYTLVQGDTNGDGVADFAISLDNYTGALKASDFSL